MKPKVIAIVIAVVITAGTATGVGVAVNRNNDKQTEELVSAAVSEALATVESTTIENTTESTTEATTAASTTAKVVQKTPKQETTTEEPQVAYDDKEELQVTCDNKPNNISYREQYKMAIIEDEKVMVFIIKGNSPNVGKYCYYDKDETLIYIDDISLINFIE